MSITTSHAHIVKKSSGKAVIEGTRIGVSDIAAFHEGGFGPAQVQEQYERLSLSEIHSALAYYYDHCEEIDQQQTRTNALISDLRRRYPDRVS